MSRTNLLLGSVTRSARHASVLPVAFNRPDDIIAEAHVRNGCSSGSGGSNQNVRRRLKEKLAATVTATRAVADYIETAGLTRVQLMQILFVEWAPVYNDQMRRTGHFDALNGILKQFKSFLGPRMLDMTAGTGESIKIAAATFGFRRIEFVQANDITASMLKLAIRKLQRKGIPRSKITTSGLDIEDPKVSLLGGSFDTVLLIQTAEFLTNLNVALNHAIYAAKKGGHIIIVSEFDHPQLTTRNGQPITLSTIVPALFSHLVRPVSQEAIKMIMSQAGAVFRSSHIEFVKGDPNHAMTGLVFEKL